MDALAKFDREFDELDKWDHKFFGLAEQVSLWSKDPNTKVGAVITRYNRILATGYNGFPIGIQDSPERLHNRDLKNSLMVHAELNAILNATTTLECSTMYSTFHPCLECAKAIIQAGMTRLVCPPPERPIQLEAAELFLEVGILIHYV